MDSLPSAEQGGMGTAPLTSEQGLVCGTFGRGYPGLDAPGIYPQFIQLDPYTSPFLHREPNPLHADPSAIFVSAIVSLPSRIKLAELESSIRTS